jgi:hypothetical protein
MIGDFPDCLRADVVAAGEFGLGSECKIAADRADNVIRKLSRLKTGSYCVLLIPFWSNIFEVSSGGVPLIAINMVYIVA